jgi:cytochrome c553
MQHLSAALSEQDIHAVAAWFAAQPLPSAEAKP